ncbi:hypothetical protein [Tautonia sociabilis]|nr:hypothetical protein [Tautonia sociabilis]
MGSARPGHLPRCSIRQNDDRLFEDRCPELRRAFDLPDGLDPL